MTTLRYLVLNDASRRQSFGGGVKSDVTGSSPDWRGKTWYGFEHPAGTQIPNNQESPVQTLWNL